MGIRFSHPEYLLLLPLLWAYTWWMARGTLANMDRMREKLSRWFRLALLTVLVLALAGMQFVRPATQFCTVFVVDVSDSITADERASILEYIRQAMKHKSGHDSAALVAFGADALLDRAPGDAKDSIQQIVSLPTSSRTNIAAGIQLAMASFPPEVGKQVVIFSDGNANLGNTLDQADLARSGDVRISVVPLTRATAANEVLLLSSTAPTDAHLGAPFTFSVIADSLHPVNGTITLLRDNTAIEKRTVALKSGKTVVNFETSAPAAGLCHLRALLEVAKGDDTILENNLADAYVHVKGRPRVLIAEGKDGDGAFLARALQANDIQVDRGGPDAIPRTLSDCTPYDSLVLANVPAWQMSPTQMEVLRSAVHDTGLGLTMIGGEESFGAGGYLNTPIEQALPVNMKPKQQEQLPSLTLVIVIDVSGSMTMSEGGIPKVRLAAEAASAAVDLLQPTDKVCVIGYDDHANYVVNMTQATNKNGIISQIERLEAGGGGILCCSSLQEAYRAIQGASTQVKHVILCADAQDTEEHEGAIEVANRMRQEKISLSIIGFGAPSDPDVPFHRQLAAAGGGQAYLAQRLSNLPQIFTRDVMASTKPLYIEERFQAGVVDAAHPIMQNIDWNAAPPLLGYVQTGMKETPSARLLLASHKKDPVLAAWSYGLGRTVAFTSDATAHWGAYWLQWPQFASYWAQSARWTLRQGGKANFQMLVTEENGRATVVVESLTKEGEFRNMLDLRAHIAHVTPSGLDGPQVISEASSLTQTGPGRYETSFETTSTGTYEVTVEERNGDDVLGMQTATLAIPYSPEFRTLNPDTSLLTQIAARAHGKYDPKAEDIFSKLKFFSRVMRDMWPGLLLLLAICFVGDVAVRRVLVPWQDAIVMLKEAAMARMPKWLVSRTGKTRKQSAVSALLATKERARAQQDESSTTTASLRTLKNRLPAGKTPVISGKVESSSPDKPEPAKPAAQAATTNALLQKKRERGGKSS